MPSRAIRFTGNPAGVVLNADGLSEAQMLAIARELNNADTAFILAPDNTEYGVACALLHAQD